MVQLWDSLIRWPCAIHDLASPRCKPRDDATCRLRFPPELHPGFEAQTRKPSTGGFAAQTTKLLDTCHSRPRPPSRQVFQSLCSTCPSAVLTWSTRSIFHVLSHLSMTPDVSHTWLITWPLCVAPGFKEKTRYTICEPRKSNLTYNYK
jgi:hypothetical protein